MKDVVVLMRRQCAIKEKHRGNNSLTHFLSQPDGQCARAARHGGDLAICGARPAAHRGAARRCARAARNERDRCSYEVSLP